VHADAEALLTDIITRALNHFNYDVNCARSLKILLNYKVEKRD